MSAPAVIGIRRWGTAGKIRVAGRRRAKGEHVNKFVYIFKEMFHLVRKHKLAYLMPVFITLALLVFLVYYIGPAVITSFIYSGI